MSAPVKKFRLGAVTANVWKNGGPNGDWYSVTVERTYKDDDDKLQNTSNLNSGDLLNAAKLLVRSEEWIAAQ